MHMYMQPGNALFQLVLFSKNIKQTATLEYFIVISTIFYKNLGLVEAGDGLTVKNVPPTSKSNSVY